MSVFDVTVQSSDKMPAAFAPEQLHEEKCLAQLRMELLRYCECLSGSRHDAEDLAQVALLKAMPVIQGIEYHPNVAGLLRRIAKHAWIDHVRKHGKSRPMAPEAMLAFSDADFLHDSLSLEVAFRILTHVLTPQQLAVTLLCDIFRYTDREAAEVLGLSRGAVKATLYRARVKIASVVVEDDIPAAVDSAEKSRLKTLVSAFDKADIKALLELCLLDGTHSGTPPYSPLSSARPRMQGTRTHYTNPFSMLAA